MPPVPPPLCPACESSAAIKNGHRYTKRGVAQRWLCSDCRNSWTTQGLSHTHLITEMGGRDRSPEINRQIWELAMSGVTMRRIAVLVGCTRRTVARKLHYLSVRAWAYHVDHGPRTGWAMMDELETFVGARWRQITVAVVIRVKTRELLAIAVGPVSSTMARGKAEGWTKDTRVATVRAALANAAVLIKPGATVTTDGATFYPKAVAEMVPGAVHRVAHSPVGAGKQVDPLFPINHRFAAMRQDLPRLFRSTWSTTKNLPGLRMHLMLYLAWVNRYPIADDPTSAVRT